MPLNQPNVRELQAIVDWVQLTDDIRELSIKFGDVELYISRDGRSSRDSGAPTHGTSGAIASTPTPESPALPGPVSVETKTPPTSPDDALAPDEIFVRAPMVGTFYASPKPGAPSFVAVGDPVKPDTVLCIVEVMKLMNSIEAKVDGTVSQILIEDNQAVEYGQPLMIIKRSA